MLKELFFGQSKKEKIKLEQQINEQKEEKIKLEQQINEQKEEIKQIEEEISLLEEIYDKKPFLEIVLFSIYAIAISIIMVFMAICVFITCNYWVPAVILSFFIPNKWINMVKQTALAKAIKKAFLRTAQFLFFPFIKGQHPFPFILSRKEKELHLKIQETIHQLTEKQEHLQIEIEKGENKIAYNNRRHQELCLELDNLKLRKQNRQPKLNDNPNNQSVNQLEVIEVIENSNEYPSNGKQKTLGSYPTKERTL